MWRFRACHRSSFGHHPRIGGTIIKTPLTITAKAWNYCQNTCPYCVSGSNSSRWKYDGDFSAIESCERLNFRALRDWIREFAPECHVHVSGGEPLLRPDIEDAIALLVNAGIPVTITTNGMFIKKRPQLLTMPLRWIVTHHDCNPLNEWLENAALIRFRPHIVCRLFFERLPNDAELLQVPYAGFNFMWGKINGLRLIPGWQPRDEDRRRVAGEVLHLIEPDGLVYPCNSRRWGPIGDVYMMTYYRGLASRRNPQAEECIRANRCPAYQTAVAVSDLLFFLP